MTSLFPKSDKLHKLPPPPMHPGKTRQLNPLSLITHPSIPAGIFQLFPSKQCPPVTRIPTRLLWDPHPRAANVSEFRDCAWHTQRVRCKNRPFLRWNYLEVKRWDAPQTEVENQSKKDGNQPGPRADTDPRLLESLWRGGGVQDSQFPKLLPSTTSRPPNPSVSNT